jgi:hypothetical protein
MTSQSGAPASTGSIEDVPDGYRAMNDREVLKFQIKP